MHLMTLIPCTGFIINPPVQIDNFIIATHDKTKNFVSHSFLRQQLGALYCDYLPESMIFKNEIIEGAIPNEEAIYRSLQENNHFFIELFDLLWLVKDHSISMTPGFKFLYNIEDEKADKILVASTVGDDNFMSDGLSKITTFNLQDVNLTLKRLESIRKASPIDQNIKTNFKKANNGEIVAEAVINSADYSQFNRIEIVKMMIRIFRSTPVIVHKIAFAGPILDCLFGNKEMNEITYKVAMRVSFYLGGSPEEKLKHYKDVTDIYNVRSRHFHGDKISLSKEALKDISLRADLLLRKIICKVIDEDLHFFITCVSEKKFLKAFNDFIFGVNSKLKESIDQK